jgi:SagB-type dehydrogenase family enzyme
MHQPHILSFLEGVVVTTPSEDRIAIEVPITYKQLVFNGLSSGLRQAIDVLASTGASEEELAGIALKKDGPDALARFYYLLTTFTTHRIIRYTVALNGQRLATLAPASAHFSFSPAPVNQKTNYVLSRFAYLHRDGQEMIMESPLSHGRITLHGPVATAIVSALSEANTLAALHEQFPDILPDVVSLFLEMLLGGGFACEVRPGETYPEESEALTQWEFHDLLFHARSRLGRHGNPYGGTYRFYHKIEPLPAIKPVVSENTIPLYRPDMDALREEDFPFTLVLEERTSIREYAKEPITGRQLGEFLYRTARVEALLSREYQDLSRRPYPGGGALYELELYLTVHACRGMPSGFYRYCPEQHVLEKISDLTEATDAMLKDARGSAGLEDTPQVLITITARFQRLSWKYESIAYSLTLKNVGALCQTMYLVATAMDLAPCALGGGDSEIFARAAGLDYYVESSVGEFLIGSKRGKIESQEPEFRSQNSGERQKT